MMVNKDMLKNNGDQPQVQLSVSDPISAGQKTKMYP